MKDTGITRRIDQLGRIVIPREIRKVLRIKEGDTLEFYSEKDQIVIKKYSPVAVLADNAQAVAHGIKELTEKTCVIVDTDKVVYVSDNKHKDIIGKHISERLAKALSERKSIVLSRADGSALIPITDEDTEQAENQMIVPVMNGGDIYGGIIVTDTLTDNRLNSADVKLVNLGATFLSKQFD